MRTFLTFAGDSGCAVRVQREASGSGPPETTLELVEDATPQTARAVAYHATGSVFVRNGGDLRERFREWVHADKESAQLALPAGSGFLVQCKFSLGWEDGEGPYLFFRLPGRDSLCDLLGAFSRLQKQRSASPLFLMECTDERRAKKWVLDLDGDSASLFRCGLSSAPCGASADEIARFERASLEYACAVLRELARIGLLNGGAGLFSVCRRHRRGWDGRFTKASLHITLEVAALQHEWVWALRLVYAALDVQAAACGASGEALPDHLRVRGVDDASVLGNSSGQNMSVMWASKAGPAFEPRQPEFTYAGTYAVALGETSTPMRATDVSGLYYLRHDLAAGAGEGPVVDGDDGVASVVSGGRYMLTSMLLLSPFTLHLRVPAAGGASTGPSRGVLLPPCLSPSDREARPAPGGVIASDADIPGFLRVWLLAESGSMRISTSERALRHAIPSAVSADHRDGTHVRSFKVNSRVACLRHALAKTGARLHVHRSNTCYVSLYAGRVFVKCFGCAADGLLNAPRLPAWRGACLFPWLEVFESDFRTGLWADLQARGRRRK